MRLTKDEFCTHIENLSKISAELCSLENALNISPENIFSDWFQYYYELISTACDFTESDYTKEYGTDLDYYCFELDFGKRYKDGVVKDADGKSISLKTAEDLWKLLMDKKNENCC